MLYGVSITSQVYMFVFLCTVWGSKIKSTAMIIYARPRGANSMISNQALQEFKTIWKAETGQEIGDKEALDAAVALLRLFDAIYRPIPKEWADEYEKHLNENKND